MNSNINSDDLSNPGASQPDLMLKRVKLKKNNKKIFSTLTHKEKKPKVFNSGVQVLGQSQYGHVVDNFLILKNIPYSHINLKNKY